MSVPLLVMVKSTFLAAAAPPKAQSVFAVDILPECSADQPSKESAYFVPPIAKKSQLALATANKKSEAS